MNVMSSRRLDDLDPRYQGASTLSVYAQKRYPGTDVILIRD